VKLLFDENVSYRLAQSLSNDFPGRTHVTTVGLRGADDSQIWDYARVHGAAGFFEQSPD
jgi:predicted nuclease of predicted toxin-antitoxin system